MFEKAKTSPSYPASLDFVFIFMYVLTVESQTYDPLTLASQVLGLQKKITYPHCISFCVLHAIKFDYSLP